MFELFLENFDSLIQFIEELDFQFEIFVFLIAYLLFDCCEIIGNGFYFLSCFVEEKLIGVAAILDADKLHPQKDHQDYSAAESN